MKTRSALIAVICLVTSTTTITSIHGQTSLFCDDFDGPTIDSGWLQLMPSQGLATFPTEESSPYAYLGSPTYTFEEVGGDSVIRLSRELSAQQVVGWTRSTVFRLSDFRYEARFDTLTQSIVNSIDGFVLIWIVDATDAARWDMVTLFGGGYDSDRAFICNSSLDPGNNASFTYQSNTDYRLVIQGTSKSNVRASLLADDGSELIGFTFAHDATAFPAGFKLGLGQFMGRPNGTYPVDVAIDYVRLTTTRPELSISHTQTAVDLQFTTLEGGTYQIQWTDRLGVNPWADFGAPINGNGTLMHASDTLSGRDRGFYRLLWYGD